MKKLMYIFTVMFCLFFFCCANDNCEGIDCGFGTCNDGVCSCFSGYEGDACATLSIGKYFGVYIPTVSECTTGTETTIKSLTIQSQLNGNSSMITLRVETTLIDDTVDGIIVDDAITASGDWGSLELKLTGDFTDNMTLQSKVKTGSSTCDITFEKQ